MHNYDNLCKIMYVTDTILRSSLRDIMRKAHEKFQSDPLSDFWKKVEKL